MNYEKLIEEYVRRNNEDYEENSDYKKYVKAMSEINLGNITEKHVEEITKLFLYKWGGMQLVLNEKKAPEWMKKVANLIQANSQRLNYLKTVDLSDVQLGKYETEIKDCYDSFKKVVKPVGAAKVLHLICPNFFPPWDNNIEEASREEDIWVEVHRQVQLSTEDHPVELMQKFVKKLEREREKKPKRERKPKRFSSEDYYRFMQFVQNFIRSYKTTLSPLANIYEKSIVKTADDYFWLATHRPFIFIL